MKATRKSRVTVVMTDMQADNLMILIDCVFCTGNPMDCNDATMKALQLHDSDPEDIRATALKFADVVNEAL